ncbi:MAG TPA: HAMP domain-containing sensor histidine kinase [Phycisphaerae bacterium]|nr:HAMP domain-containing sensor histidine kinase [Phycisphaerae bacterium]
MWRHVQTLRFKLAGLYLLVFGAILAALCVVIFNISENNLRNDFDKGLQNAAEAVADKIQIEMESSDVPAGNPLELVSAFRFPGYYFEQRGEDGSVLARTQNLGSIDLPWDEAMAEARSLTAPVFVTVGGEKAEELIGNPGEVRLMTLYREPRVTEGRAASPFYLQVAVNTRFLKERIDALSRLFLILVPSGLMVAAVASWFVSGRALQPIEKIRHIAERLSVQDLSQRFEQPRGRDEVALMVETINKMLDRLHNSFQAQERFIGHASHELKTPLSVLLGEAQVLKQKRRQPEEYEQFVGSVQDEVRSLAQMVDSVLTLARAEAGLPMTTSDEVSVNEIVIDAVERCQPQAKQREVRIVPHLAMPQGEEPEPIAIGDGDLLRLMFVNLIRNAIRYSPPGRPVEIVVTVEGNQAIISVRDQGPGIPPEYIDRVFDRFFRVPEQGVDFKGVGLGLTIVRGIAQLHGGTAVAANRRQGGCEFIVRLPLARRASPLRA